MYQLAGLPEQLTRPSSPVPNALTTLVSEQLRKGQYLYAHPPHTSKAIRVLRTGRRTSHSGSLLQHAIANLMYRTGWLPARSPILLHRCRMLFLMVVCSTTIFSVRADEPYGSQGTRESQPWARSPSVLYVPFCINKNTESRC